MDSTTIKRDKPAKKKKKNTVTVNSVILMSLGYFYLFISTRIYENRLIHLPCLSLFTVLFAYVASFVSCFVVRDLCSISSRFRVLSNPPLPPSLPSSLPPSLARGCFSVPIPVLNQSDSYLKSET